MVASLPKPENIIVRMPNWIGDVVMATPVLIDLRRAFPEAKITAMCRAPMAELLEGFPYLDEIFQFTKPGRLIRRDEKRNLMEKLRQGKYDTGILLPNTFSSAWWFWQAGIRCRIGYTEGLRGFLLTHPVSMPKDKERIHLTRIYKNLLSVFGIPPSSTLPELFVREEEKKRAGLLLSRHGVRSGDRIVGVNPGAAYGSAKCWLPERFREVTLRLLEDPDVVVVYFGDRGTADLVKEICKGFPRRVVNLAGETSLRELPALIARCDVLLTNDSGPMHIAGAVKTPVVALFGSTNSVMTGPWGKGIVIHKKVSCSPCYKRVCPIDFRCMKRIETEEVLQAVRKMLELGTDHSDGSKLSILP